MESEGVSLPLFHEHLMVPWNDLRKGDCCGSFESSTDGFYCKICDFFLHKKCSESSESIQLSCHSEHTLKLKIKPGNICDLCERGNVNIFYRCVMCDFDVDLSCVKYPPPEVIDISETHHHKLTFFKEKQNVDFQCSASTCGKTGYGFHYKCHECDLAFHVDCVWHPSEVNYQLDINHSYHSLHLLKLINGQPPDYSDGKCRLCGRKVDKMFYHCSSCNFTLDLCCVLHPPSQSLLNLKVHDHKLTLLPRLISFSCNACGLNGDRSPYVCVQCDFVIHQDCLTLPRLINVNRHDHRVSHIPLIGIVNSVCGVCRQKVDWTCGGYSCKKCLGYVVHSKCATRKDVWNGKELEGIPEETEDIEPYVVIDENTIQHFSHKEHHLRLHVGGIQYEDNKWCNACTYHIGLHAFYSCMDCNFILHQTCAECPKKKWHVLHNERLTLVTSKADDSFWCYGCDRFRNGFRFKHGRKNLDIICGSISEPFFHRSHPHHPLYYIPTQVEGICNGCKIKKSNVLRCIEDGCGFVLDFRCATLPQLLKHRVNDHPLSLCYGEKASGKYWCDICEKETNPEKWFYTCKDRQASLHVKCVLGDFAGLMPRSTAEYFFKSYEVVLNNSISRPFCWSCKLHCIPPIILKMVGTSNRQKPLICQIRAANPIMVIEVLRGVMI